MGDYITASLCPPQNAALPLSRMSDDDSHGAAMLDVVASLMRFYARHGDVLAALRSVLPQMLQHLSVEAGSLFLSTADQKFLECVVCHGPVDIVGMKLPLDSGLVGRVYQHGRAELVHNTNTDLAHRKSIDAATGFVTRSTATAPVSFADQRFGVMQIVNPMAKQSTQPVASGARDQFSDTDMRALTAFATSLGLALSNLDLTRKLVADSLLKHDMEQAKTVQAALLPDLRATDFAAGYSRPANELSGDFYDYVDRDQRCAFCIGDVSGKGIAAALMMTRMLTLFRHLVDNNQPLAGIVSTLNQAVLGNAAGQFVTCIVGTYDRDTDCGQLVNCGHIPAIWLSDESSIEFPAQLMPLGVAPLDRTDVVPVSFTLKHGWFVFLTDGVTETKLIDYKFNDAYFAAFFRQLSGQNAAEKTDAMTAIFAHSENPNHDDSTVLVIARPRHA